MGATQQRLADISGVPVSSIKNYESGGVASERDIYAIAAALQTSNVGQITT